MTTYCPGCGAELTAGARFCASCGSAVVGACASCGAELPAGAAFCPACGASQAGDGTADGGPEELRVVSCLFADLAGFTSHTERSSPEDVRARLAVYHRKVREDVERWGGTVEKLMGDGVFAVFGVPTVHEDDPERAVRAALRLQESVAEMNAADPKLDLSVRIGVTTGEAVVLLEAGDENERIIGDVVNTASRLEGVAPPGGVVVDERTYLTVRSAIEFEPLGPVSVKGKADPVAIWQAGEARSRYGVAVEEDEGAAFVGRQEELSLLVDALERSIARRRPQLVTISGEPGVGKSRMIREFRAALDERADLLVRWRQGRSLPYGEGVTFWALSEIVKSEAGILESEPPEEARAKLDGSIGALTEGRQDIDAAWLRQRLGPLAGTGAAEGIDRSELFSAWLTYIELLAAKRPLVLVIEDLHWADDALADFIEHVLDWALEAPLLIACTARPEWFTRRPDWGGGKREAVTIGLLPLSAAETAQLVASLSGRTVMAADAQQALLDRSGGNPLYLTEYVRLAEEKGWFEAATAPDELPLPDSVQAIIAARLDLLEAGDKALLQAAAVVGRIFWSGALSFLRDADAGEVGEAIRRIVLRELVRPVRRSSMQGQEEFIFTHVLARDVAYGQLTRTEKARLHRETARWLEAVSGGRAIDVAELLAHHHATALELEPSDDPDLLNRVYRFLMLASERNESLDPLAAARFARRAAGIAPGTADRARALKALGRLGTQSREEDRAALSEAIRLFAEADDLLGQADALHERSRASWYAGNRAAADADLDAALELVDGMPDSVTIGKIWAQQAALFVFAGREEEAIEMADRVLGVAQRLGDVGLRATGLRMRGTALEQIGDPAGGEDLDDALRIALDLGDTGAALTSYNNRAEGREAMGQAQEACALLDEAIAFAEQRGRDTSWLKSTKCQALVKLGDFEEVGRLATEIIEASAESGASQVGHFGMIWRALLAWIGGDVEKAWSMANDFIGPSREIGDPQVLMPALSEMIAYADAAGHLEEVTGSIPELLQIARANPVQMLRGLDPAVPTLVRLGFTAELAEIIEGGRSLQDDWPKAVLSGWRALLDEAHGDHRAGLDRQLPAIEVGDRLGLRYHTTRMRIEAARNAIALGESELADELLATARTHATEMGMRIALDTIDDVERTAEAG